MRPAQFANKEKVVKHVLVWVFWVPEQWKPSEHGGLCSTSLSLWAAQNASGFSHDPSPFDNGGRVLTPPELNSIYVELASKWRAHLLLIKNLSAWTKSLADKHKKFRKKKKFKRIYANETWK